MTVAEAINRACDEVEKFDEACRVARQQAETVNELCAWTDELKAYRETGLTPEEIHKLISIDRWNDAVEKEWLKHLQMEKDGRLVMLPDAKYTDADGEKALQKAMWVCGNTNNPVTRYTADAIAEKLCREARDKNPPLTLEELREMDGEPVWVCEPNGTNGVWGLVDLEYQMVRLHGGGLAIWENNDKSWLAYRRKPEEASEK